MGNCLCVETRPGESSWNSRLGLGDLSISLSKVSLFIDSFVFNSLQNIYIEDETCCICANNYDDDKHEPKILPCGHILCYYCMKQLASKHDFENIECPLDRKIHPCRRKGQTVTNHLGNFTVENTLVAPPTGIPSGTSDLLDVVVAERWVRPPRVRPPRFQENSGQFPGFRFSRYLGVTSPIVRNPLYDWTADSDENLPEVLPDCDSEEDNATRQCGQNPEEITHETSDESRNNLQLETSYADSGMNSSVSPVSVNVKHKNTVQTLPDAGDVNEVIDTLETGDDDSSSRITFSFPRKCNLTDIYNDRCSVRSYQWVEPDYPLR